MRLRRQNDALCRALKILVMGAAVMAVSLVLRAALPSIKRGPRAASPPTYHRELRLEAAYQHARRVRDHVAVWKEISDSMDDAAYSSAEEIVRRGTRRGLARLREASNCFSAQFVRAEVAHARLVSLPAAAAEPEARELWPALKSASLCLEKTPGALWLVRRSFIDARNRIDDVIAKSLAETIPERRRKRLLLLLLDHRGRINRRIAASRRLGGLLHTFQEHTSHAAPGEGPAVGALMANNRTDRGVASPVPPNARVSSGFGSRVSPLSGRKEWHEGLDLAVPVGTLVKAVSGGVVSAARLTPRAGWVIEIAHDGGLSSRYKHLSRALVRRGEHVDAGQAVGLSGGERGSGSTTGPHLHLEIRQGRNGRAMDPRPYLRSNREGGP